MALSFSPSKVEHTLLLGQVSKATALAVREKAEQRSLSQQQDACQISSRNVSDPEWRGTHVCGKQTAIDGAQRPSMCLLHCHQRTGTFEWSLRKCASLSFCLCLQVLKDIKAGIWQPIVVFRRLSSCSSWVTILAHTFTSSPRSWCRRVSVHHQEILRKVDRNVFGAFIFVVNI